VNPPQTEVLRVRKHSHAVDWGEVKAHEAVTELKKAAKAAPHELPAKLLEDLKNAVDEETAVALPKSRSLHRFVQRNQVKDRGTVPRTFDSTIELPSSLRYVNGEDWLLADIGSGNQRQLIFATQDGLRLLARSSYWIADGTFKSVPRMARQLYSVHARTNNNTFLPCVYSVMGSKSKDCYETMLSVLKRSIQEIVPKADVLSNPKFVSTDFELSAITAFRAAFPTAQSTGCYFHFAQIMWRKLQNQGLQETYNRRENEVFRKNFKAILGLPFVPLDDVEEAFDEIVDGIDDRLLPVCEHLSEYYLKGKLIGRRKVPPLYPPELWNVHDRTLSGMPRTTNSVEGWHNKFNTLLRKHHVNLLVLVERLLKMEGDARYERYRDSVGKSPPKRKKKYVKIDDQIKRVVERYSAYKAQNDLLSYATACGMATSPEHFMGEDFSEESEEMVQDLSKESDDQDPVPQKRKRSNESPSCEGVKKPCVRQTMTFKPPDKEWQMGACKLLGLKFQRKSGPLGRGVGKKINVEIPPQKIKKVKGDGNCLFRAISYWVTGNEEEHARIREVVCEQLREGGHDVNQMSFTGEWGTEREILAIAELLQINVWIFSVYTGVPRWLMYPLINRKKGSLYLDNSSGNHFDVVIGV
jgi:hypothetical protein